MERKKSPPQSPDVRRFQSKEQGTPMGSPRIRFESFPTESPQLRYGFSPLGSPQMRYGSSPLGSPQVRYGSSPLGSPQVRYGSYPLGSPQMLTGSSSTPHSLSILASQFAAADPSASLGYRPSHSLTDPRIHSTACRAARISDLLQSDFPVDPIGVSEPTIRKHRSCGLCGSAFLALKHSIVPRGVFGKGRRARTAEGLAFLVYVAVVSVSLYWVAVYAYLYFNTGWLGNLSTTFATYRSLEAPSVVLCRDVKIKEELPWTVSAEVRLHNGNSDYTAKVFLNPCPRIRTNCRCLDTYNSVFRNRNQESLPGLPVLNDISRLHKLEADSIHVTFRDRHHGGAKTLSGRSIRSKLLNRDTVFSKTRNRTTDNGIFKTHHVPSKSRLPIIPSKSQRKRSLTFRSRRSSYFGRSIDRRVWLGIYDSKLIPSLGDEPTWIVLRFHVVVPNLCLSQPNSEVTLAVALVRSWVIDPQRIDVNRLLKGEIAHGEHTYLLDIQSITDSARYTNVTSQYRQKHSDIPIPIVGEILDRPLISLDLSFSSYTVIEVWRVGLSMSVALVGLAAICLSAFNKMFIFNTLFPFYDAEHPQKINLTLFARLITCGYFGSNHEDVEQMQHLSLIIHKSGEQSSSITL